MFQKERVFRKTFPGSYAYICQVGKTGSDEDSRWYSPNILPVDTFWGE